MEESTGFISTGRPGQVIKTGPVIIFITERPGWEPCRPLESVKSTCLFLASLLHLFSDFLIKAGVKGDSAVCLLFCFKR